MYITVVLESIPKQSATNRAALRAMLGVEPVRLPGYAVWCEHDCLCPCDVAATLSLAGYGPAERDELGDYYVTPNVQGNLAPKAERNS